MANETFSPNMNLPIPSVGSTSGPDYADDINDCMDIIDSHDHSSGYGVQITPAGININSDFEINDYNLIEVRTVRLYPQPATLSGLGLDKNCIYSVGPELYYNDGVGNPVQITDNGSIAGATGTIGGLTSPASATYVALNAVFIFQSNANVAASLDARNITLRNSSVSSYGMTLSPPSMGANISITLPALPSSQKIMTLDNSGNMSAPYTVDGSTITIVSNVIGVPSGGITNTQLAANSVNTTQLVANAVTTAKIASGAITNTQLASNSVQSANIASGAVTNTQLASNAVQTSNIASGAVTNSQIASGAVQSGNIASGAVGTSQLASTGVTQDKLQASTLGTSATLGNVLASSEINVDNFVAVTPTNLASGTLVCSGNRPVICMMCANEATNNAYISWSDLSVVGSQVVNAELSVVRNTTKLGGYITCPGFGTNNVGADTYYGNSWTWIDPNPPAGTNTYNLQAFLTINDPSNVWIDIHYYRFICFEL